MVRKYFLLLNAKKGGVTMGTFMILLFVFFCIYLIWKKMPEAKKTNTYNDNMCTTFDTKFRSLLKANGINGVDNYTDDEIKEIFRYINDEFDNASKERNEQFISGNQKLKILAEILNTTSIMGKEYAIKHLQYEVERFRLNGIRKDNKGLF